jgi:hypothetical protein
MREFVEGKDKAGNRKQKSVKARNVSMCRLHGEGYFDYCTLGIAADPQRTNNTSDMSHARARIGQ